jgi:RNA polymerase-binding protein DksA
MDKKVKKKTKNSKTEFYGQKDKEYFRELIMRKRAKLLEELGYLKETSETTLEEYSGDNSTYSFHMADQGTDAQEREKAFLFASREGKFLAHLDRALDRINDDTYGNCEECGEPIAKARLEAVPHARMCVECKTKLEQK